MHVRSARVGVGRAELVAISVFVIASAAAVAGVHPIRAPDSASYLHIDLLGRAERLWTVPLVYRLLPGDGWRVGAQTAVFVFGWILFARTVAAMIERPALGLFVTVAILSLGLATLDWNLIILSESLTMSLMVIFVATWLRLERRRTAGNATAFVAATLLFTFARQLNVAVALPVIAAVVIVTGLRGRYPRWVAATVVVVACWGAAAVLAGQGDGPIQRYNSMAILVNRILPDANARAYFEARGLELSGAEQEYAGRFVPHEDVYLEDRVLVQWTDQHFLPTYASYLAAHPGKMATGAARGMIGMLVPVEFGFTRLARLSRTWNLLWGSKSVAALAVLAAVTTAAAVIRGRFRWTSLVVAGVAGVVLATWWLLAVWVLSTTELGRLSMPANVLLRLGLVVILAQSADVLLGTTAGSARRSRRAGSAGSSGCGSTGRVPSGAMSACAASPGSPLTGSAPLLTPRRVPRGEADVRQAPTARAGR